VSAIRARWPYVVVAVVVAVVAAVALTHLAGKRYEAGADVLIDPVPSGTLVGLPVLRDQGSGSSVITAARLANSPQVKARARAKLGVATAPAVTITPQQQSSIVTITGSSSSANQAAKIANAYAQSLVAERSERYRKALEQLTNDLQSRLNSLRSGSPEAAAIANQLALYSGLSTDRDPTLEIVSPAVPPSSPSSPRPLLNVALAAMFGLLLGAGIALALEVARPRARTEALTEDGPPILARIPRPTHQSVQAAMTDPAGVPVDIRVPMRTLWAKLRAPRRDESQAQTFLITGAGTEANESGPAVAAVLAALVARGETSVALVDADIKRGPLSGMVDHNAGSVTSIARLLASNEPPLVGDGGSDATWGQLHTFVVRPEDRRTEWLSPHRLPAMIADLKSQVDVVVISAPPPPATETMFLADLADAVIVAVDLGEAKRDQLTELLEAFAEQGVTPVGFVTLDPPSLLTRIADVSSSLTPSPERRWA
jgi:capsular polysaccharide biosynthesis protein